MSLPAAGEPHRRETRLLLATIAVSVGMLVVLAQFRFPEEIARETAEPAPAPLERLAAFATFDELADTMGDLERRLASRLAVVRVLPEREAGSYAVAPRVTADRAVLVLGPGETLAPGGPRDSPPVVARDSTRDLAVLALDAIPEGPLTPGAGIPRTGPRYVAVFEATARGPVIRPMYVGRIDILVDPRTGTPLVSIAAAQHSVPRGAAIFSLAGQFIGLTTGGGATPTLVPADTLKAVAESARPTETRGDVGLEVQSLTQALARAAGAANGVMVSYVRPEGPAAGAVEPGDVITGVDGVAVTTTAGFDQVIRSRTPAATAVLQLTRRGKPTEAHVEVRDSTGPPLSPAALDHPGVAVRSIPGHGVEIVSVLGGGPAARAGLNAGDIVVRLDGREAPSADALMRSFRETAAGGVLLLGVKRGQQHHMVALERR